LGLSRNSRKAGLVAKLAAARKRKRVTNGKCEGRKSLAETNPQAVGFLNERGAPFNDKSIASMLAA
jgi:hypothetical protein